MQVDALGMCQRGQGGCNKSSGGGSGAGGGGCGGGCRRANDDARAARSQADGDAAERGQRSPAAAVLTTAPAPMDRGGVDPIDAAAPLPPHASAHEHERAERLIALGTIAGLIAHEFNNILTPVVSYSQMALQNPADRELATKALQKALAGSERAAQIAEVILGFVRDEAASDAGPASGGGDGHACSTWNAPRSGVIAPVTPVRTALDNALHCMARSPDRDGIRLHIDVPDAAIAAIRPIALQHVLLNLILNARAAMVPGGGELRVLARARSSDPHAGSAQSDPSPASPGSISTLRPGQFSQPGGEPSVEITIQDTGRGMSTKQIENLFVPFQTNTNQLSGPAGERRRGTGLGMTICKRLVEDAGGYIAVRSAVNQGTTVRIVLPAAAASAAGKPRTSEAA